MRYQQTSAESAELLRLTLPMMSRHGSGYHPISYAVWYEYVSGINPELKERVDFFIKDGQPLVDDNTYTVYRECIIDAWGARAMQVNEGLRGLMDEFTESSIEVHDQIVRFDGSLEDFTTVLSDDIPFTDEHRAVLLEESRGLRDGLGSRRINWRTASARSPACSPICSNCRTKR